MKHLTVEQLFLDIMFLAQRASWAGHCPFTENRDVGMSSNSIVSIAYELIDLSEQIMPLDRSDLMACEIMFTKLPEHRKTDIVLLAMSKARNAIVGGSR